jgi:hypothetical protein
MQSGGHSLHQADGVVAQTGGVYAAVDGVRGAIPFQFVEQAGFAHAARPENSGYGPHFGVVFGAMKMEPVKANFFFSTGK